jgi:hypothetical protein
VWSSDHIGLDMSIYIEVPSQKISGYNQFAAYNRKEFPVGGFSMLPACPQNVLPKQSPGNLHLTTSNEEARG